MAAGDFIIFDQFLDDLGNKIHDLQGDTIKMGFIKSAANGGDDPAASDAAPHWGGTGTTNFATAEVTAGGNYSTGGVTVTATWAVTTSIIKFDTTDVSITYNAANPTNARWGILYNSTDTNKRCIGYLDLGVNYNFASGDFTYSVPTNGIFRIGAGTIT